MNRILRVVTLLTLLSSVTWFTQAYAAIAVTGAVTVIPCNGQSVGAVNINASGGIAPYTYHWSNGSTIQNQSGLAAGIYSLTVKDNTGDTSIYTFNVSQPAPVSISKSITNENCGGQHMGAVNLMVSGGTAGYTYLWSNGATTQNLANLYAQVYYLTLTDANGCTVTDSANVTQPPGVGITMNITPVSCSAGLNNGAIAVSVQFGNPAYQYNWADGPTSQNRTGLTTGNYNLTVTDAIGCTATAVATVNQLPGSLSINTSSVHPTCYNGSNGTINTTPVGSMGPYSYLWNDGATTQNRTGLTAATYTVTATSSTGCSASATIALAQPAQISITLHSFPLTCYNSANGAVTSTVSGGNSPYSYLWNNGDITSSNIGLSSNTYTLTVTDNKSCTATQSVLVSQPAQVTVTAQTTPITCSGGATGSIVTTVSGGTPGYSYSWGGGVVNASRANVAAGTYNVTVTDSHGCSGTTSTTITPYVPMSLFSTQSNVICYGKHNGSITITPSNGIAPYSYTWSNGASTAFIDSLPAGNYSVTVADVNSCTAVKALTINAPPFPITVNSTASEVTCFGLQTGSLSLNPINGAPPYNFKWANGATTSGISNLAIGNYSVTITDSSGCKANDVFTITQPPLIVPVTTVTNDSCFGSNTGSILLNVTGGYAPFSYAWNDGIDSQSRAKLYAGTYTVTMTDNHACTASASATVNQPTALFSSASGTNPSCFGGNDGSITLTASGGTGPYSYNWGVGITTQARSGLSAGNYNVTVTDNMGCSSHSSAILTAPAAINISATASGVACSGGNNGTINIIIGGGTPPYSFDWGGGITSQNRAGLQAGNYTVTVTDHAGCTATNTTTVNQAGTLNSTVTIVNVTCYGLSNGSLTATATGGTGPYTFLWNNGNTAAHITGLGAGNYSVMITDHAGCSINIVTSVTQPSLLSVSSTTTSPTCFGTATGTVHIVVNGGTSPYTYNWSSGITSQNRNNLSAGSYTVSVTDSSGCSVANTSVIAQPSQLSATINSTAVLCYGGSTGSAQLAASGATSPYSYTWANGSTTISINNLITGTYTATVRDANGCSVTASANISQPAALAISTTVSNVSCNGLSNGAVNTSVNGGTGNYTFNWNNGATTANISAQASGNYSVTVNDAHSCSISATAMVGQPAPLSLVINAITNANCNGAATGSANIQLSGGTPNYTYVWSTGATTQNLSSVAAGNYQVSATDTHGCSTTATVNITQPAPITVSTSVNNALCNGSYSGSIIATANGGNGGFTYAWNNSATTAAINQLAAGNYQVTVSDALHCSSTAAAQVNQPAALLLTSSHTDVACNGTNTGTAVIQVAGGTNDFTYNWSDGQTTTQISALAQGIYPVTVTDANGCSASTSVHVNQINSIVLNTTATNESCFGQSAGVVQTAVSGGAGGYRYHWNNGATTANLSSLIAGNYNITVTDANNCNTSASATVSQPAALVITPVTTDATCFGSATGSIQLTATGGTGNYQYNWSNGSITQNISTLATGNYSVTVKDANLCSATATAAISQPAQLSITLLATTPACNGSSNGSITSITHGGNGPYTYNWSNNNTATNLSNIAAGNYNITVTDAQSCTASASANLTQPLSITARGSGVNASCNSVADGIANLQVSGGTGVYTYHWNNQSTSPQLTNLQAGIYTVTVLDSHACSATASASINQPAAISVNALASNYACASKQGKISLTVTGGSSPYNYRWQDAANTQNRSNLSAGNYSVTVTDAHQCIQTASASVSSIPELTVSLTAGNTLCFGGNNGIINSMVTGGTTPYSYNWSNAAVSNNIQQLTAGNYNLLVTDQNGCSASATAAVSQPAAIQLAAAVTPVGCFGLTNGGVQVTTTGGTAPLIYNWNNGSTAQNISNISSGNYSVTVTDANHCTAVQQAVVTQAPQLNVTSTVNTLGCSGVNDGSISLSTQGGTPPYIYNWSSSTVKTSTLDSLSPGNYAVTVNDNNGCSTQSTFVITTAVPLAVIPSVQNSSCQGVNNGSISLQVSGGSLPYHYNWNNGQSLCAITDLSPGNYTVTVTDHKGCSAESAGSITTGYNLLVHAATSSAVSNGAPVTLSAVTSTDHGNIYSWTPANYVNCSTCATTDAQPQQSSVFTIYVTDANGCKASDTVSVAVLSGTTIYIPNAFTPNDDGINDQFKIYGDLSNVYYFNMLIFDRWGEKVFESNNPNFEWYGQYKGEAAPQGVYIYVASMVFNDGSKKDYKGSLTLLK